MIETKLSFKKFFIQLYIRFRDDDISSLSAQLSFSLLMSLFPFLLFLLSVASALPIPVAEFTEHIVKFMPGDAGAFIAEVISEMINAKSTALLSLSAVVTVWGSSRGIGALSKGLNKAYDKKESRSFFKMTVMSIVFTIGMALLVIITLLSIIFGSLIGEFLSGFFAFPQAFLELWVILRYAVPIALTFVIFTLVYTCVPCCGVKVKEALPGAVFSTAGWIVTSLLFSFYAANISGFTRVYGSIGGIIILLIWIYISCVIIMIGGEMNATFTYFRSNMNVEKYENPAMLPAWLKRRLKHKHTRGK
ncbi:MAG: YihY/virulence factor BrkB family protein [Burkholderiales bacterium]